MIKKYSLQIESKGIPVVELDSTAHAAYIRFSTHTIAKTIPLLTKDCLVTMDLDANGKTVGVELVGVKEFKIDQLLKKAGIRPLPKSVLERVRYVPVPSKVLADA